jgi:hypothetical protein
MWWMSLSLGLLIDVPVLFVLIDMPLPGRAKRRDRHAKPHQPKDAVAEADPAAYAVACSTVDHVFGAQETEQHGQEVLCGAGVQHRAQRLHELDATRFLRRFSCM